jgi:hypothetical protein
MKTQQQHDAVNHPAHYTQHPSGVECIAIAEHFPFNVGSAIKYLWRAGLKSPDPLEDLRKAAWYIEREIKRLEGQVQTAGKTEPTRFCVGKQYRSRKGQLLTALARVNDRVHFKTDDEDYFWTSWGDGSAFEEVAE